jgi:Peptidase S24-like
VTNPRPGKRGNRAVSSKAAPVLKQKPASQGGGDRERFIAVFVDRLNELMEASGVAERGRPSVAARMSGLSRQTTSPWFARQSLPDLLSFKRIVEQLQADPLYLLGIAPQLPRAKPRNADAAVGLRDVGIVPVAFTEKYAISAADLQLITMDGDAMEPLIRAGEIIGIDTRTRAIRGNGIYALEEGERLLIRRVDALARDRIALICENDKYQRRELRLQKDGTIKGIPIAGRVMFSTKSF